MNPSDKAAFVSLVTDALAYYGKPVSTFTLQVWWQACQKFDLEQVTKARGRISATISATRRSCAGLA